MELLAAASFVALLLSGLAVGGRLLLLARATQRGPELFVGASTTLLALAAVFEVAAMELAQRGQVTAAHPIEVVALLLHSASSSSLCFGVWRVFYPERGFAPRLCLLMTVLLFESWAAIILPGQHTSITGFTPWFHLHVGSRGAAFAWGAVAAFAHWRRLRRRRALGLAEPFLCHRFGLWALAMACTTSILGTAIYTNTGRGVLVFAWPPALLTVSALGLAAAAALWLAFLPPAAYRRFVTARARLTPA